MQAAQAAYSKHAPGAYLTQRTTTDYKLRPKSQKALRTLNS